MTLGITEFGIAERREDGAFVILRPHKNGRQGVEIEVPAELAEQLHLATGDVLEGAAEPLTLPDLEEADPEPLDDYEQIDEPSKLRGETPPEWLVKRTVPTERLIAADRINGLPLPEAAERPSPREKRSSYERVPPGRNLPLSVDTNDTTGRMLDLASPFGAGYAGLIYGPHGSGLTRTLQSVVDGVSQNAPDVLVIVLLLRARGEEITDWRRKFPEAEVVVCPTVVTGGVSEETLRLADLVMEAAKRQTELGRHVLLAVDSLTGLWGAMLEVEEADAQREADQAFARRRMREWLQNAGDFGGEGLLGNGLGGSLTIVGTAWHQEIDVEAEEEGETHPHLRLMEHILHETGWRVPLLGSLASARLYPAIDVVRGHSQNEASLVGPERYEHLAQARKVLGQIEPIPRYNRLMDALESVDDTEALLELLAPKALWTEIDRPVIARTGTPLDELFR